MSGLLRLRGIVLAFAGAYALYLPFSGRVAALLPLSVAAVIAVAVVGWRLARETGGQTQAVELQAETKVVAPPSVPLVVIENQESVGTNVTADVATSGESSAGPISRQRVSRLLLALIFIVAAALRLYALGRVPAGFFCDEASVGYNAYSILQTGRDEHGELLPLYFRAFGEYKNPVYIYAASASIAAFGLNEFATRLPAALFGLATIPVAFLLGRRLFDDHTGLLAAALLAIAPWHVHFSRIAFELIALPFFFGLGLWLCLEGFASKRRLHYVLGGLCLAVSLYTYAVARLFVPVFLAGFALIFRREWRADRRGLQAAVLAFVAGASPLAIYTDRKSVV